MSEKDTVHPWYGPCDALGPEGVCAECKRVEEIGRYEGYEAEAEELIRRIEARGYTVVSVSDGSREAGENERLTKERDDLSVAHSDARLDLERMQYRAEAAESNLTKCEGDLIKTERLLLNQERENERLKQLEGRERFLTKRLAERSTKLDAALARIKELEEGLEQAQEAAESWLKPAVIKLAAGEMTAQELRTAQAVAGGIARAIRSIVARSLLKGGER